MLPILSAACNITVIIGELVYKGAGCWVHILINKRQTFHLIPFKEASLVNLWTKISQNMSIKWWNIYRKYRKCPNLELHEYHRLPRFQWRTKIYENKIFAFLSFELWISYAGETTIPVICEESFFFNYIFYTSKTGQSMTIQWHCFQEFWQLWYTLDTFHHSQAFFNGCCTKDKITWNQKRDYFATRLIKKYTKPPVPVHELERYTQGLKLAALFLQGIYASDLHKGIL